MYNPYDKEAMQKAGLMWTGFILLLALAFIILKLIAIITWSWWWVLAPIWIPMALGIILNICGFKPPGQ